MRLTCKEVKVYVDKRITKLLLINQNYSGISYKVKNAVFSQKNMDYLKLYSQLMGVEIKQELENNELVCTYVSSQDFNQSPMGLLNENPIKFWGSKGHDSPKVSEYVTFSHKDGYLLDIESVLLRFYRESEFDPPNDFFPAEELIIRVGLFEHKFDFQYGPFKLDPLVEDSIFISFKEQAGFLAKYVQLEFVGLPGLQMTDHKYYLAVQSMKLSGSQFNIKSLQEDNELVKVLVAYYKKQDFFNKTVFEYYKQTFPKVYEDFVQTVVKELTVEHFVLGDNHSIVSLLHKPALTFMVANDYPNQTIFEYINQSSDLKNDWECLSWIFEKPATPGEDDAIVQYLDWIEPKYGMLNEFETRLIVEKHFFSIFKRENPNLVRVERSEFDRIVSGLMTLSSRCAFRL
jgi:hypothetical protein